MSTCFSLDVNIYKILITRPEDEIKQRIHFPQNCKNNCFVRASCALLQSVSLKLVKLNLSIEG